MTTQSKFEVYAEETGPDGVRYRPGVSYDLEGNDFAKELIHTGRAHVTEINYSGGPCPTGKCALGETMTTNPGAKVVEVIKGLKAEVEKAADEMVARCARESERTKDGFHKVEKVVLEPWEAANRELDDFVNQLTNGGPPLELEKKE